MDGDGSRLVIVALYGRSLCKSKLLQSVDDDDDVDVESEDG